MALYPARLPGPSDGSWDFLRKILLVLTDVVSGATGFLVRGTFSLAANTSTTPHTPARGQQTVITAGTAVQLSGSSVLVNSVILVAAKTNTGAAYYGSGPSAPIPQVQLPATLTAPDGKQIDLSLVYVDTDVSGDKISWEAVT